MCTKDHSHWREVSVQNDPWVKEVKSSVRCAQYLHRIDPRQGYGSRGLQAVPQELRTKFNGLNKDGRWQFICRKCRGPKGPASLLRGDGTQMLKEVPNQRACEGFDRTAKRVRNATGATAVYEERVRGVLQEPQLASGLFSKPDHQVWTFGQPKDEPVPPRVEAAARDGR